MPEAALMSRPRREDQPSWPCLCSRHLNLKGQIATEGAIPQELLKFLEIACANSLFSGRETGWLGSEAGVLTVGAGVEPLEEQEDAVTGEDIVDKLLFVVQILHERDDTHALKNN